MAEQDSLDYDPEGVPDEEIWAEMKELGLPPESLPQEKDRIAYRAYLEKLAKVSDDSAG